MVKIFGITIGITILTDVLRLLDIVTKTQQIMHYMNVILNHVPLVFYQGLEKVLLLKLYTLYIHIKYYQMYKKLLTKHYKIPIKIEINKKNC